MERLGVADVKAYADILKRDPAEVNGLFEYLLVPTTAFFREHETCEILQRSILPKLIKNRPDTSPIRVWVPGCSSGEEAYSLGIMLLECMRKLKVQRHVQIFATDLSEDGLRKAREGVYPEDIKKHVSEARLKGYFVPRGTNYQVSTFVRGFCTFARHDVLSDQPFSRLDLISCQNVLMYFDVPSREKVLQNFFYALNPGGFLVLGGSENICGRRDLFSPIDSKHRIYQSTATVPRTVLNSVHHSTRSNLEATVARHGGATDALPAVQREIAFQRMESACAHQELRALRQDLSWVRDELRTSQKQLEQRVAERTSDLQKANRALQRKIAVQQRLEGEILRISDEERRRIAQDLHDGLGQQLTGAIHLLTDLRKQLVNKSPAAARSTERLVDLIGEAAKQTRGLAQGISPVEDELGGLPNALRELAQRTQSIHRISCRLRALGEIHALDNATATHLYRIAQEAVNNAVRHAKPSHIDISLEKTRHELTLAVRDDGLGFSAESNKDNGMGLRIMKYRAHLIGGTLKVIPRQPHGTTVVCKLKPLSEQKAKANGNRLS